MKKATTNETLKATQTKRQVKPRKKDVKKEVLVEELKPVLTTNETVVDVVEKEKTIDELVDEVSEKVIKETKEAKKPKTKKPAPAKEAKKETVPEEVVVEATVSTVEETEENNVSDATPILPEAIVSKIMEIMGGHLQSQEMIDKYLGMYFIKPELFTGNMKEIRKDVYKLAKDDIKSLLETEGFDTDLAKEAVKKIWKGFVVEIKTTLLDDIEKSVKEELTESTNSSDEEVRLFNLLNEEVKNTVRATTMNVEEAANKTALAVIDAPAVVRDIKVDKPAKNLYSQLLEIASIKSPTNEDIERMYKNFMVLYVSEIMDMKPEYVTVEIDKWISLRKNNKDWFNLVSFWVLSAFDMSTDTESFIECMNTLYPVTNEVVLCAGGVQEYFHTLAKEINFALGSGEYYSR